MSPRKLRFRLFLPALALLVPQVAAAQSQSASGSVALGTPGPVAIQMNQYGLTSLTVGGQQWLLSRSGQTVGDFYVAVWRGSNAACNYEPRLTARLNGNTTVQTYAWGSAQCTYTTTFNTLEYNFSVTNTDPAPLSLVMVSLGDIFFPNGITPAKWDDNNPPKADNYTSPAVLTGDYGKGVLGFLNDDLTSRGEIIQFNSKYWGGYPMRLKSLTPLAPGATATFHVTLRWASEGTNRQEIAPAVWATYQAAHIQQLNWKDRRPIGSIFLASVNQNFPTNPRGWFTDRTINVFTTQGLAGFKSRVMAIAAQVVKELQDMNAQGCIVWDIEGEQYPQGIATFIGDPMLLPTLAPEMDPIADGFFSTIKNAGFRVGVCLRCQHLEPYSKGGYCQFEFPDNQSIVNALDQRITYAQQRWGCTLFYIDTNGGVNGIYDVSIFQQLQGKHPDVLLIPELKTDAYFAYTAPYYELRSLDGNPGTPATPAEPIAITPGAFSVINTADGDVVGQRAAMLAGVKRGDILMYRTWYASPESAAVKSIYQQATANGGPVASPDIFSVHQGTDTVLDVLLNDFDQIVGRSPLQVINFTQPTAGSVYMQNGALHYVAPATPPANGQNTFTFDYTASDGVKTSTAPVTVSVGR